MRQRAWGVNPVLVAMVGMLWAGGVGAVAAPATQTMMAQGKITTLRGSRLTIASDTGEQVIEVGPETLILSREVTTLGTIRPGDALGVAAKRGADGTLTAISIAVFSPELWSRARKGQWPMESGDVMTNAVVIQYADRVEGRTLYMKYNDGAAAIIVPVATEIHRLSTIQFGDLRAGMRVSVRGAGNPDGTIKASTIILDRANQV